ncbi:hypothetical protein [Maridesulfovibrio frigidus]|uniref:hypothetical protein n=1 Tax=Maridesulfovibrio frigidus TaxID=340956 RepID=UPI0004E17637|nr:hypothetical protein [Maridesulfovibrio frigidus]
MPNFTGMKLTRHGMELLGLVGAGTVLDFTRIAVGSGIWNESQLSAPAELTALLDEAMSLDIGSIAPSSVPDTDEPAGCYTLHAMLTNSGLVSGFALREIGIFATHPSRGEILYAVDYAGEQYDYIPQLPAGAAPLEKQFRIDVVTGNAAEITIMQSPVLLATQDDIVVHDVDSEAHPDLLARLATGIPEIISPADGATDIGETPIISAHEFVPVFANTEHQASQWQVDLGSGNFSNPVFDSGPSSVALNSFEIPAGYLQVSTLYKVRTRRRLNTGQWSPWSDPKSFTTRSIFNYAERPANTLPVADATNVQECPTLMSGPFAVVGDTADTHAGIQFRIRQGDTVLHLSPELGVVLEYLMPAGLLQVSTDYVFECRHKGTLLSWSEWSTATGFRTSSAFITGDEAVFLSAWNGHDDASAAGVALADNAALRSNGVDQDAAETDWAEISMRAKVRDKGIPVLAKTDADTLFTNKKVLANTNLITNLGAVVSGDVVNNFNNKLFFAIQSELYEYDIATGTTTLKVENLTSDETSYHAIISVDDDTLLLAIGYSDYALYKYTISTNSLVELTKPPSQGYFSLGMVDSDTFILWAGNSKAYEFTLSTNSYVALNDSVVGICKTMHNVDGKFYFAIQSGFYEYDIATGTITLKVGNLTTDDTTYHAIISVDDDTLLLAIGYSDYALYKYTISTNSLVELTKPPSQGYFSLGMVDADTFILWAGSSKAYEYTLSTNSYVTLNDSYVGIGKSLYNVGSYEIDISSANFSGAPSKVHVMPALTAAYGPDGISFVSEDFIEIPIETTTLGTDSDPDRPDFILLESIKQIPAESFRRVALGVSELSKDSECRVSETQIDTWKTGA